MLRLMIQVTKPSFLSVECLVLMSRSVMILNGIPKPGSL